MGALLNFLQSKSEPLKSKDPAEAGYLLGKVGCSPPADLNRDLDPADDKMELLYLSGKENLIQVPAEMYMAAYGSFRLGYCRGLIEYLNFNSTKAGIGTSVEEIVSATAPENLEFFIAGMRDEPLPRYSDITDERLATGADVPKHYPCREILEIRAYIQGWVLRRVREEIKLKDLTVPEI